MKKTHIIALLLIAVAIAVLISFMGNVTTYETIASAKEKPGKFVNIIVKVDKSKPMTYDPVKNPNFLEFTALDTLGNSMQVVYHNSKPTDMEKSERVVLKGRVEGDHFECKDILLKCPSKYKDDPSAKKDVSAVMNRNVQPADKTHTD
ncbi:MAG TPA: cytochrome c maturation protein CcmE [Parafilimonas sp.]|nr:cytochrome c maturation protein CcmE [Parafilimonas sp.]